MMGTRPETSTTTFQISNFTREGCAERDSGGVKARFNLRDRGADLGPKEQVERSCAGTGQITIGGTSRRAFHTSRECFGSCQCGRVEK